MTSLRSHQVHDKVAGVLMCDLGGGGGGGSYVNTKQHTYY